MNAGGFVLRETVVTVTWPSSRSKQYNGKSCQCPAGVTQEGEGDDQSRSIAEVARSKTKRLCVHATLLP